MHHAVVHVDRVATGNAFDPAKVNFSFSDTELLQECGLMSPMSMMRYSRLALFVRIAFKRPEALVSLLSVSWGLREGSVREVGKDFVWLPSQGLGAPPFPPWNSCFGGTCSQIRRCI